MIHLHVAAIPTAPAITALVRQCKAIHERLRVREFIIWNNLATEVGKEQSTLPNVQHEDYKSPTPSAGMKVESRGEPLCTGGNHQNEFRYHK